MKLQTVKNIVIAAVCTVLAAGNVYQYAKKPADAAPNIVFFDTEPSAKIPEDQINEGGEASTRPAEDPGPVDLNSASLEELVSLPGIGTVKARAILEYRRAYGRFVCTEEIMEVSGIGQATYDKIKDRITVK